MNQPPTGPVFGKRTTPPGPDDPGSHGQGRNLLSYDGRAGRLFGMGAKIALLSLLTLGFYRFWGKTRIRRYLASRMGVMGDRFEYTGTGRELFLGFLIALAVLIPLGAASYGIEIFLAGSSAPVRVVVSTLQYAFILFLIGYATFRARRYRLSRTVLRSIRFWQTGSNVGYALRMMGYFALTIVTLGIARPVGDVALHRYLMQNTWFGSRKFEFDGQAGDMMGRWILALLLVPFTLGLSLIWYAAYRMRYLNGRTSYQEIQFALPVTFGNLVRIYGPYLLLIGLFFAVIYGVAFAALVPIMFPSQPVDTETWMQINGMVIYGVSVIAAFVVFGLIAPVLKLVMLTHRFVRLVADRLEFIGDVDIDRVMQSAAERPETGEGLADALDIGGGLEVGI